MAGASTDNKGGSSDVTQKGPLVCCPGPLATEFRFKIPSSLRGRILLTMRVWPLHFFYCLAVDGRPTEDGETLNTRSFGFPGGSDGKASACSAGDLGSIPGLGRFPRRRKWQPTPVFLPGKSHGQRSLVGYSPRGRKELDMTE